MTQKPVPFHGNPDGVSCAQCTYRSALEYLEPEKTWDFSEMDKICGAIKGKYTWPFKPLVELQKLGFDVIFYTTFDTARFLRNAKDYMIEKIGLEGWKDNLKNSDMPSALAQAREYAEKQKSGYLREVKMFFTPSIMRELLEDGYLLSMWVNYRKINNIPGMAGHSILVFDYNENGFYIHDSGDFKNGVPVNQYSNKYISDFDLIDAASPVKFGETDDLVALRKYRT